MKKLLLISIALASFIMFFPAGKKYLASFLLTQQLSSENEVINIRSQKNLPLNPNKLAYFNNLLVNLPPPNVITQIYNAENLLRNETNILGSENDRWIEINLSQQRLYAWEGGNIVYNYLVSTGKWAPTPIGNFKIWIKLAKTTMTGGSKALGTYYYLPNVPCTMYFYKGYGIHGTYWHNNFGQPMSHGCVNMKTDEACTLFAWASVGTRVNIHY